MDYKAKQQELNERLTTTLFWDSAKLGTYRRTEPKEKRPGKARRNRLSLERYQSMNKETSLPRLDEEGSPIVEVANTGFIGDR